MSLEQRIEALKAHRDWLRGTRGGKRLDWRGKDLKGAKLARMDLRKARLSRVKMSWFDATLISERLWQAAGDSLEHQMLAAFVGHLLCSPPCGDDQDEDELSGEVSSKSTQPGQVPP